MGRSSDQGNGGNWPSTTGKPSGGGRGNGGNWPSTTGKPSGGGRGNGQPKGGK